MNPRLEMRAARTFEDNIAWLCALKHRTVDQCADTIERYREADRRDAELMLTAQESDNFVLQSYRSRCGINIRGELQR